MKDIIPNKFYSAAEAAKILGVKARQTVIDYIKKRYLRSIVVGGNEAGERRYGIKGEWLLSFLERHETGNFKEEKFTREELRKTLRDTLEYCEEQGIKTYKEFCNHVKNL